MAEPGAYPSKFIVCPARANVADKKREKQNPYTPKHIPVRNMVSSCTVEVKISI
jgi:hypothetical protein